MDATVIIVLGIIFFVIFMILPKNSKSKKKRKPKHMGSRQRIRKDEPIQRNVITSNKRVSPAEQQQRAKKRQLALSLEKHHQYREAADIYLELGEIFNAAKAIAKIGENAAPEVIRLIQQHDPAKLEMLVRNLVRFFYDTNRPLIAAALLDEIGLHGQADAIRATVPNQARQQRAYPQAPIQPARTSSTDSTQLDIQSPEIISQNEQEIVPQAQEIQLNQPQETRQAQKTETKEKSIEIADYSIPIMLAPIDLNKNCSVCKGSIKAGQTYTTCPVCQNPAHSKHLLEWIKVKGTCPICKTKLRIEMFQL